MAQVHSYEHCQHIIVSSNVRLDSQQQERRRHPTFNRHDRRQTLAHFQPRLMAIIASAITESRAFRVGKHHEMHMSTHTMFACVLTLSMVWESLIMDDSTQKVTTSIESIIPSDGQSSSITRLCKIAHQSATCSSLAGHFFDVVSLYGDFPPNLS